jgi:hypothetical protein
MNYNKKITKEEEQKQTNFEEYLRELITTNTDNQTTLDYNSK